MRDSFIGEAGGRTNITGSSGWCVGLKFQYGTGEIFQEMADFFSLPGLRPGGGSDWCPKNGR